MAALLWEAWLWCYQNARAHHSILSLMSISTQLKVSFSLFSDATWHRAPTNEQRQALCTTGSAHPIGMCLETLASISPNTGPHHSTLTPQVTTSSPAPPKTSKSFLGSCRLHPPPNDVKIGGKVFVQMGYKGSHLAPQTPDGSSSYDFFELLG